MIAGYAMKMLLFKVLKDMLVMRMILLIRMTMVIHDHGDADVARISAPGVLPPGAGDKQARISAGAGGGRHVLSTRHGTLSSFIIIIIFSSSL